MRLVATTLVALAMAQNSPAQAQNTLTPEQIAAGWINLFDGKTLYGWQPTSDANWTVDNGEIRVSSGAEGWLMTTSEFADYELHVEFKAPATTNSGIFLRTPLDPKDPTQDCIEVNIAPEDNPFPTGSLVGREKWETNPRNMLAPLVPASVEAAKEGWESFDVQVDGDDIAIRFHQGSRWPKAEATSPRRGRIGLQFREGEVAFRNIRLKPLAQKPMLGSNTLEGWRTDETRAATFTLTTSSGSLPLDGSNEHGQPEVARAQAVVRAQHRDGEGGEAGTSPEGLNTEQIELHVLGGPGELETQTSHGDFVLQLDCFVDGGTLNSGIFFRSIPGQFANGYESQIHNGIKDGDPTQPIDAGTGAIYRRTQARRVVSKDREWFTKTIVATGPHIAVWVNGVQVTDWTDDRPPDPNPRKGLRLAPGTISLQAHDPTTNLRFRNLRISELPPPSP